MYGPPPAMSPAPPGPGPRVTVWRVLGWVLMGGCLIGGVGLFACVPLAVLAVRNRSRRDALLAAGALVFAVVVGVATQQWPHNPPQPLGGILAFGILGQGVATTVYWVRSDRRRAGAGRAQGFVPAGPYPSGAPYQAHQPYGPGPWPADAVPPLPQQSDRLGQVRAELDELSDYLRREQGR